MEVAPDRRTWTPGRAGLYFALLWAISILPLLLTRHPPLQDYANHLARLHVLTSPDDPFLARFYTPDWALRPNLAFDLVGMAITRVLPLDLAGRVYLGLCFAVIAGGPVVLNRVVWGRFSVVPFFAFPLVFNRVLQVGFLGYFLSVGLIAWALASWLAGRRRPIWQRLLLGQVWTMALFIGHMFALGVFGLALLSYEAVRTTREQGWTRAVRAVGLAGLPLRTEPRCHLPKCPVV